MPRIEPALLLSALLALSCAHLDEESRGRFNAHRDLGSTYLQRGESELAIREFRAALSIWDRDAEAHFSLGEAYRQKRAFEDAEDHFRRALDLDPGLLDARLNLGVVYLQQERWRDAIRENEKLIEDPTFLRPVRALVNLGWAHYKLGDRAAAAKYFRQAIATDKSSYQAHLNLGIVLYDEQALGESVQSFGKVLELLSGRPAELFGAAEAETRFRLAMAHVRLGQRARAIEELRIAAERGGETAWAKKSRDYLAVLE
jgi:Tfp pilus assembly protein PilF